MLRSDFVRLRDFRVDGFGSIAWDGGDAFSDFPHLGNQMNVSCKPSKTAGKMIGIAKKAALALLCLLPLSAYSTQAKDTRPNVLLIVADDMGYADTGSFGGEIRTPNIDSLAAVGIRFTQFDVSATCSPSRSMLLSGTDNHLAGLGNMAEFTAPNQKDKPGYEGYLNDRVAPLASLLRDSGYKELAREICTAGISGISA